MKRYLQRLTEGPINLWMTLAALTLVALGFCGLQAVILSLNGRVCNHSSIPVWLTLTESGRHKAYSLSPGQCTNLFKQDAEAIWGKDCHTTPCKYQAWKVSAGRFDVETGHSTSGSVLLIKGWGARSRWHITREWPKPDLASIDYSLVR